MNFDLNTLLDKATGKTKEIDLPDPTEDELAEMDVPPDPKQEDLGDDRKVAP